MITVFAAPQRGDDIEAEHITTLETAVNALEQRFDTGSGWATVATPSINGGPIKILTTGSTVESADGSLNTRKSLLALYGTNHTETDVAQLLVDQVVTNLPVGSVAVTAGGSGYTSVPAVAFSAPQEAGGVTALGTATVVANAVTAVTITNAGSGYRIPPTVTITGGGGSGATATATLAFMARTGILARSFTPNDTGGDSSAILAFSTGASNALSVYRIPHMRPSGFHDYSAVGTGLALEVGTTANFYAVGVFAPSHGIVTPNAGCLAAFLDGTTSKGILVDPRLSFDSRVAYGVGNAILNAPDTNLVWKVLANGTMLSTTSQDGFRGTVDNLGYVFTFLKNRGGAAAAANDIVGDISWTFVNTTPAPVQGAMLRGIVIDPTAASEDTQLWAYTRLAGALNVQFQVMGEGVTIGAGGTNIKKYLSATATWDPASIANGIVTSTTITVTGAAVGDPCSVGLTTMPAVQGMLLTAHVESANTVRVNLTNFTGSTQDLASGTLRAGVWKH